MQFVGNLLSGSMVGLMVTFSKWAYATCWVTQTCCSHSPCPYSRPLLTCFSAGDTQTLKGRSGSVSVGSLGPGVHTLLLMPSEHLWKVWDLILIEISPLLQSYWCCSFALDVEYHCLVGSNILLSMVDQKWIAIWSSQRRRRAHTLLPCHLVISTGIGEFNSDDHYIYHCRQESLRRNGVAFRVNKRVLNAVFACNLKNDRIISVCFQNKPLNITAIQVYAPTISAGEAEVEQFYEDIQDLLELTTRPSRTNTKNRCPFHHRGLECKSRKSRDTWSIKQVWPWSKKWSMGKANRVSQGNTLVIANTVFHNPRDDSTHGHNQMVNTEIRLIILFVTKEGDALYSQRKQDWELTVAEIMNSLFLNSDLNWKKYGKPLDHSGMT